MKKSKTETNDRPLRPALTPEGRENQLILLATDLAEKQLREGTASSQVITHFLKLATTNAKLETERLIKENKLLDAKAESIQRQDRIDEMYAKAVRAMSEYQGRGDYVDED